MGVNRTERRTLHVTGSNGITGVGCAEHGGGGELKAEAYLRMPDVQCNINAMH